MSYKQKLEDLIRINKGMILTKDVSAEGIPREYIFQLVEDGVLIKIDRSSYISKDGLDDKMYRIQAKHPSAIFSHESALHLHGMPGIDELTYSITVPTGYNSKTLKETDVLMHFAKKDLYTLGICSTMTPYGREIKVYDLERTICDLLRSKSHVDCPFIAKIIKFYANRTDNNISKLIEYANILKVSKKLQIYIDVLL